MSDGTAAALRFIAAVRTDPQLRARLAALAPGAGLEPVVALAREAGFSISAEDLRRGFTADWGLRRARYLREAAPDSAASTVAVVQRPESGR
ncbi:MAG TPA: Nif11-like leader peptide family natural product precursor [Solirubrobacteraceae bacterium]|nr:Nif11-like leader peptide family natural product precursor [Solirubrobacteraceae bacterium]